jgi:hypothetical protein
VYVCSPLRKGWAVRLWWAGCYNHRKDGWRRRKELEHVTGECGRTVELTVTAEPPLLLHLTSWSSKVDEVEDGEEKIRTAPPPRNLPAQTRTCVATVTSQHAEGTSMPPDPGLGRGDRGRRQPDLSRGGTGLSSDNL